MNCLCQNLDRTKMRDPYHYLIPKDTYIHNYIAIANHEPTYFEKYVLFFLNPILYGMGQALMIEFHDVVYQYHNHQNDEGLLQFLLLYKLAVTTSYSHRPYNKTLYLIFIPINQPAGP